MASKSPMGDLIVILPGILGSVLQKDGKDFWAASGQSLWATMRDPGMMVKSLYLAQDDPDAADLGDGVKATRVIEDATIVPGFFKVDGYTQTAQMITQNFNVVEGDIYHDPWDRPANFYRFPYDWRRDNRANAKILKSHLDRRLKCWRSTSGNQDAKVILLAHSMGGLVSRYYLEVLGGWRDAKALFTFGTPYRGAMNAASFLANGYKNLFLDLTDAMRSMTAVYQLLPIYEAIKIGDGYHRIAEVEHLPNINQAKAQDALAFHREIEAAVTINLRDEAYRKNFTTIPIVGVQQPTPQSAELRDGKLTVSEALPEILKNRPDLNDGDGTVPQVSAIPIELSNSMNNNFIAEMHGALQTQKQVLDDIRERLTLSQFDLGAVKAAQGAISLSLEDLYLADEPIRFRARLLGNAGLMVTQLIATITAVSGDRSSIVQPFVQHGENDWELSIELPAGLYRIAVSPGEAGEAAATPVHDLFEVVR
jgi:hypothetical protein